MTKQELNRRVTALAKKLDNASKTHNFIMNVKADATTKERSDADSEYQKYIRFDAYNEFMRLEGADSSYKSFTAKSLLNMLILNRRFRFIPFHSFASRADLDI